MSKKPIIVFEGIEGSGKSHHISVVSKYLDKKKKAYIKIREPGGNPSSEKIRKLILNNKSDFNKNTDLLLYLAARSENMNLLRKYYKKKIILIDRFVDSTIAYQHFGMGISKTLIKILNKFLLGNIKPDLTILNLVSKKNLIKRLKKRKKKNRYDKFSKSFYIKAQKAFVKLAKKNKKKYFIYDNSTDDKNLEKEILKVVLSKLK